MVQILIAEEVMLFLRCECTPQEIRSFRHTIRRIENEVSSEDDLFQITRPWLGPTDFAVPPRYFRFGGCRAFLAYDYVLSFKLDLRIRIVTCRRVRPQ